MISFTLNQYFLATVYAFLYGALYKTGLFVFRIAFKCILSVIHTANDALNIAFIKNKSQNKVLSVFENAYCWFKTFVNIIIFSLGYIVLTYCTLDGCIRAYTLLSALVGYGIAKYIAEIIGRSNALILINRINNLMLLTFKFIFAPINLIIKALVKCRFQKNENTGDNKIQ